NSNPKDYQCTRSDSLAAGNGYPPIKVIVNVTGGINKVANSILVGGGGDNQRILTEGDPTFINTPSLSLTKSHSTDFSVGVPGNYTIIISNPSTVATAGEVRVIDNLPLGLTATSID